MVGTGVFTTTGVVLPLVGSPLAVLAIWAVSGVLALCGAAAYAELGAMMPRAGGEYVYLTRAFHPAVGFMAGWLALLVGFARRRRRGRSRLASTCTPRRRPCRNKRRRSR